MMPTINLGKKHKPKQVTVNIKLLHVWYNCARWKRLRAVKWKNNPLCEVCESKGITRQTEDIHHIVPIDINHPDESMIYNYDNLMSVCKECHSLIHRDEHRDDSRAKEYYKKKGSGYGKRRH